MSEPLTFKSVKVGGTEYKFIPLDASTAMDFCMDALVTFAPVLKDVEVSDDDLMLTIMRAVPNIGLVDPVKMKNVFRVVRGQMQLPNGRLAQDEASFQEWFRDNPSHLLEAHMKGLAALVRDFFPQGLGTLLDGMSLSKSSE